MSVTAYILVLLLGICHHIDKCVASRHEASGEADAGGWVVGVVIGAMVLLCLFIVIIMCCVCKKSANKAVIIRPKTAIDHDVYGLNTSVYHVEHVHHHHDHHGDHSNHHHHDPNGDHSNHHHHDHNGDHSNHHHHDHNGDHHHHHHHNGGRRQSHYDVNGYLITAGGGVGHGVRLPPISGTRHAPGTDPHQPTSVSQEARTKHGNGHIAHDVTHDNSTGDHLTPIAILDPEKTSHHSTAMSQDAHELPGNTMSENMDNNPENT